MSCWPCTGSMATPSIASTCWSKLGQVGAAERVWLQSDGGARLLALREQTSRQARSLDARCVSNTVHALAKLAIPAAWEHLWKELERAALARVSEFDPQGLANRAWAFATAGRSAPALFDAMAAETARRVRDFNPQDLANTAWAFATAGHTAQALFHAMAAEAERRVREFNPQNLANTAWAFATAGRAASAAIASKSAGAATPAVA